MKRSEVLNHIKEDLLEKLKHRWLERGETDKWAEFTANQLLDMIEGFGMLPPLAPVSRTEVLSKFNNGQQVVGSFTYIDHKNEWEPEDEEK